MPTVIPVKFRYASRDLWFDPHETEAIEGDHVICETERGLEIGLTTSDASEIPYDEYKRTCGDAPLKPIVRLATEEDLSRAEKLADKGEDAMSVFRRLAKESELDMKPVGVEYLFDGDKVVCYFSADERVDFRQLVRDLSRELHNRIDMRQIGVREEAALMGGFGHCGQELCCTRFGRSFDSVSIRMAKEQDLPLNSAKISGACGRLMCCLRYEFEAYRDFKQRAPKRNAVIDTPLGKAKIVEYDTPKEELALRLENGKIVRVKLAEMETSESAVKKSEELNCPCRPDTVTRAALERLSSPDVQMALAELDREAGLIPEETFDADDLFVMAKPRRRARSVETADAESDAATSTSSADDSAAQAQTHSRRRRRRRGVQNASTSTSAQGQPSAPSAAGSTQKSSKEGGTSEQKNRRRTRRVSTDVVASSAPAQEQQGTRRRRRHHNAEQTGNASQSSQSATQVQTQTHAKHVATGDAGTVMSQPTRRRRPGDHGGAAGVTAPKQAQDTASTQADASNTRGPKRRRRRRHRNSSED